MKLIGTITGTINTILDNKDSYLVYATGCSERVYSLCVISGIGSYPFSLIKKVSRKGNI